MARRSSNTCVSDFIGFRHLIGFKPTNHGGCELSGFLKAVVSIQFFIDAVCTGRDGNSLQLAIWFTRRMDISKEFIWQESGYSSKK